MKRFFFLLTMATLLQSIRVNAQQKRPDQQELDTYYLQKSKEAARIEAWAMAGVTMAAHRDYQTPELKKKVYEIYLRQRIDIANAIAGQKPGTKIQLKIDSICFRADTAVNALLTRTAPLKGNSWFAQAARMRQNLQLTQQQTDALKSGIADMNNAALTFKPANRGEKFDSKAFQAAKLSLILTEEQCSKFFAAKSYPTALKWALTSWSQIKERGFATDSVATVKTLILYNTTLLTLKERYANDMAKRAIVTEASHNTPPQVLQMLKAAQRINSPATDRTMTGQFKW